MKVALSKRQKFIAATILLLAGIVLIRLGIFEGVSWRLRVAGFALFSLPVTLISLWDEDLSGVEVFILPILPICVAVGSVLVYPLLPVRLDSFLIFNVSSDTSLLLSILMKLVFLAIFVVGYYASLLTSNIYNVAAVRGIQLLRVAQSIGFLLAVASALMFYLVIASFHLSNLVNLITVFGVSLLLAFYTIWSVGLQSRVSARVVGFSLVTALILGQIAWALSFWPVSVSIFALFLTAIFYEAVGIIQYHLNERLNRRVVNEFVMVAAVIIFLIGLTATWGA
ncbi:MAG: hypothetical protein UY21_C0009G0069 [Microgenomates group bacterium GW2011_GWA1_48_10]|nr:MAG: hypothetical protein UY21_C0009G0069 [Microgenomates group bacterium GW2011_GWA1_48_10]